MFKSRGCDGGCDSCGSTHVHKTWAPSCGCDACGEREGLFAKLKARFAKHGCGCDGGCATPGCAGPGCAPSVPPPEPVNPPKKMPVPGKEGPPPAKTTFEAQSSPLPSIPATTAPSIEVVTPVAPVAPGVPSITNQPRSPF